MLLCRHTVPALYTSCFSGLCRIQLFLPEPRPWLFILGLWVLVHLFVPWFLSVQTEVLDEEENIKEDGEDAKSKLSWVSEDQRPLVIIVRLEEHLEEAKAAPCEVQKHTANAPALSAFVVKVHVGLWKILDQRDGELDVGEAEEEL